MNKIEIIFLFLICGVNAISFILMGVDKYKAGKGAWRISEKSLFALAFLGGAVGILAGMYMFRHKTRHRIFVLGIPLIVTLNIIIVIKLFEFVWNI